MARKTITFTFPRRGLIEGNKRVEIAAEGFVGGACTVATKPYIDALGKAEAIEETDEMHKEEEPPLRVKE